MVDAALCVILASWCVWNLQKIDLDFEFEAVEENKLH